MGRLLRTDLIKVRRPPTDNSQAFQEDNLKENIKRTTFQLRHLAMLQPTGMPRYFKGNLAAPNQ